MAGSGAACTYVHKCVCHLFEHSFCLGRFKIRSIFCFCIRTYVRIQIQLALDSLMKPICQWVFVCSYVRSFSYDWVEYLTCVYAYTCMNTAYVYSCTYFLCTFTVGHFKCSSSLPLSIYYVLLLNIFRVIEFLMNVCKWPTVRSKDKLWIGPSFYALCVCVCVTILFSALPFLTIIPIY